MSAQRKNLIHMANQIAENLRHGRSDDQAAKDTTTHLEKFWARSMKADIIECLNDYNSGLNPVAHAAVGQLKQRGRTS
ncbi:MAG: formate dehydrogenase subunit delta [Halomonas sp.]|uniref:formate dehydrogenase subunit delta n=1 Tax=Halomonas sp. TaxID=1486246 RepID=UPI003F93024E